MIPKIIHYCWFGGNELPELAQKCIASWKKYLPDYEIKEWNENNFNLEICDYVKEAYDEKRWAFISDYVRFWALYNYGGLYFDTDVEVLKDMTEVIKDGPFMGCETDDKCAPGLGLGATPHMELFQEILDFYNKNHFKLPNGRINIKTVVGYTTDILKKHGFVASNGIQQVLGVKIYPPEYFCPMSYNTGKITITENTYTIHHYTASWKTDDQIKIEFVYKKVQSKLGDKIAKIVVLPIRLRAKIKKVGLRQTIKIVFMNK